MFGKNKLCYFFVFAATSIFVSVSRVAPRELLLSSTIDPVSGKKIYSSRFFKIFNSKHSKNGKKY